MLLSSLRRKGNDLLAIRGLEQSCVSYSTKVQSCHKSSCDQEESSWGLQEGLFQKRRRGSAMRSRNYKRDIFLLRQKNHAVKFSFMLMLSFHFHVCVCSCFRLKTAKNRGLSTCLFCMIINTVKQQCEFGLSRLGPVDLRVD